MALWIDDLLTDQPEWYEMSGDACALLVELWVAAKRIGRGGALETHRMHRLAEHYSNTARDELIAKGWMHPDGAGCDSELCLPLGVPGFSFMHNLNGRQESSVLSSDRQKSSFVRRRKASVKANHTKHHANKGIKKADCGWCNGEEKDDEEVSE
jgi:hypothetical protein